MTETFFSVYSGLPRQGPGSEASTCKAIRCLPKLPEHPRVLDLGSGTGSQTLVLAREVAGRITAIDFHQPYLDLLQAAAWAAGLAERIETRCLSMDALDYPPASFDLIWSEGALYVLGIPRALELCRPLLPPGGLVAFTEITWLADDPPPPVKQFWDEAYPAITSVFGNIEQARSQGFSPLNEFTLPSQDWWTNYYGPLRERVQRLRTGCEPGSELDAVLTEAESEIRLHERFSDHYGYVFYILRKAEIGDNRPEPLAADTTRFPQ